jgi:hypothetical protein
VDRGSGVELWSKEPCAERGNAAAAGLWSRPAPPPYTALLHSPCSAALLHAPAAAPQPCSTALLNSPAPQPGSTSRLHTALLHSVVPHPGSTQLCSTALALPLLHGPSQHLVQPQLEISTTVDCLMFWCACCPVGCSVLLVCVVSCCRVDCLVCWCACYRMDCVMLHVVCSLCLLSCGLLDVLVCFLSSGLLDVLVCLLSRALLDVACGVLAIACTA